MRVNEAERATLEERARLAREIHDGLAQHLWFAKLKFERLSSTIGEEERPLADEVTQALDAAIVEAREALVTMRSSLEEDVPFADMLVRSIDDFESSSGLRAEYTASTGLPSSLAPRVQVELLRIVNEALNNVRKHADATIVRVTAEVSDWELVIRVTDNGRGFSQNASFDRGMGLQGMRERARLVGGTLLVMSELSGGTTIEVRAPLVNAGVGSMAETSERTTMAPDEPADASQLELLGTAGSGEAAGSVEVASADAAGAEAPAGATGTASTADARPSGMQT
jgi:signal transduction histidine kinase